MDYTCNWPSSSSGSIPHIILDFIIWHSSMRALQRHPDNTHQNLKTPSPLAFSKSLSLWAIKPLGKTHNKESNSSSKHVSLHFMGTERSVQCGVVPLWLWFVPNATKRHTVMTCQGQPFCSQTLTQAFQRQLFIPKSTDHSEIMLVVRLQVGNVQSVCLETKQMDCLQSSPATSLW